MILIFMTKENKVFADIFLFQTPIVIYWQNDVFTSTILARTVVQFCVSSRCSNNKMLRCTDRDNNYLLTHEEDPWEAVDVDADHDEGEHTHLTMLRLGIC